MKNCNVLVVNAFTHNGKGGNPAGVVLEADKLTQLQKQTIAKDMALSETAFVSKSLKAEYKVEFFTPTSQVPLCGHATIATWHVLIIKNNLKPGVYSQELQNGVFEIEILSDGSIVMEQEKPKFGKKLQTDLIAPLLDINKNLLTTSPKPQIVSTGLEDLMVGVKDIKTLNDIMPDFEAIKEFQRQNNEAGIHVFALKYNNSRVVARCRNFCPLLGIPEESATGSSTGALLCYLFENKILDTKQVTKGVWFEQGFGMGMPSNLFGKLKIDSENQIQKVEIGGKANIIGTNLISF